MRSSMGMHLIILYALSLSKRLICAETSEFRQKSGKFREKKNDARLFRSLN